MAACTLSVGAAEALPGEIVVVSGDHFPTEPATVQISIGEPARPIAVARVDANGHFTEPVVIPSDQPTGPHILGAECATTGTPTVARVELVAVKVTPSTQPARPLVRTGSDTEPLVLTGSALLAAGLALVLTARRRRAQRRAL